MEPMGNMDIWTSGGRVEPEGGARCMHAQEGT